MERNCATVPSGTGRSSISSSALAVASECLISANSRCVRAPAKLRNKSVPGTRYGSNTGSLIGMYYLSSRPYRARTRRPNVAASINPFA
ncbi:hypothetical protein PG2010B_1240 [Bifidobacterium animalis subsp. lactis]|nr:hypothetical protein PG2007B_1297 [Bifidobacterium animalis subsp. lactis]RYM91859.1 hypothetical protein PG2010B_1240 [Bifidobacterium animalis subsp. lactis]